MHGWTGSYNLKQATTGMPGAARTNFWPQSDQIINIIIITGIIIILFMLIMRSVDSVYGKRFIKWLNKEQSIISKKEKNKIFKEYYGRAR